MYLCGLVAWAWSPSVFEICCKTFIMGFSYIVVLIFNWARTYSCDSFGVTYVIAYSSIYRWHGFILSAELIVCSVSNSLDEHIKFYSCYVVYIYGCLCSCIMGWIFYNKLLDFFGIYISSSAYECFFLYLLFQSINS